MDINFVYITTGSMDEARTIARELVSNRFAAGANIIDNVNSIYWWDGKIQDESEAILILKTTADLVPELIEKVKSMHSYICPCVVSLPVQDGNRMFLDWIVDETMDG